MPVLGLTMEEGTVAEWLKREGETVRKDEPLLTVEMDKGTVEVPAPASGVLRRIVVQPGTTVPVKTLIAEIDEGFGIRESGVGSQESGVRKSQATEPAQSRIPNPDSSRDSRIPFSSPRARMRDRKS